MQLPRPIVDHHTGPRDVWLFGWNGAKVWSPNCWVSNKVPDPDRSAPARGEGGARRRRSSASAAATRSPRSTVRPPRNGPVALGVLPKLIGYHLRLTQRAVFDDFAHAVAELDVSPGLFGMLVVIEANPGLKQTELARAARLDRSTLVPALDKLEARGLVTRRAATHDRRVNGLWLTPQGAALLRKAKQRVARHEARLVRGMTAAERDQLLELLGRILPERR